MKLAKKEVFTRKDVAELFDYIKKLEATNQELLLLHDGGFRVKQLEAQNAVLRQALERSKQAFFNLGDLVVPEQYRDETVGLAEMCHTALKETPAQAAERVQGLVDALKNLIDSAEWINSCTYENVSNVDEARDALAKWERGE